MSKCFSCEKPNAKICSGCKIAAYCDSACQLKDRIHHQEDCEFISGKLKSVKWDTKSSPNITYRFQRSVGKGADGEVFKATKGDTTYALKLFADERSASKEVAIIRSLSRAPECHRYISCYVDHFYRTSLRDNLGGPVIVLEWIDGITLKEYSFGVDLDDKPNLRRLLIQALIALQYIHSRGVVWNDIHVENMMVVNDSIKLLDFGNSCMIPCTEPEKFMAPYGAPERISVPGTPPTVSSDICSLGISFGSALIGHGPQWVVKTFRNGRDTIVFDEDAFTMFFQQPMDYLTPMDSAGNSMAEVLLSMTEIDPLERPSAEGALELFGFDL